MFTGWVDKFEVDFLTLRKIECCLKDRQMNVYKKHCTSQYCEVYKPTIILTTIMSLAKVLVPKNLKKVCKFQLLAQMDIIKTLPGTQLDQKWLLCPRKFYNVFVISSSSKKWHFDTQTCTKNI